MIDIEAIERVIREMRELSNLPSMGLIGMRGFLRKEADALEAALKTQSAGPEQNVPKKENPK